MVITITLDVCWNGHQSICDVSTFHFYLLLLAQRFSSTGHRTDAFPLNLFSKIKIYLYTLIADQENHPNGHMTQ